MIDLHIHSEWCGHARGEVREMVEAGKRKGIKILGFAEHFPRYYLTEVENRRLWNWNVGFDTLERYKAEVLEADRDTDGIEILFGTEADYIPGFEKRIESLFKKYDFDFTIGSIHVIPEWSWGYLGGKEKRSPEEFFRKHYKLVKDAARSGLFDILGHIDLPYRHLAISESDLDRLRPILSDALDVISKSGTRVEINGRCMDPKFYNNPEVRCFYPDFVKDLYDHGIRVAFGSDAHSPDEVGSNLRESMELLLETGYSKVSAFGRGRDAWEIDIKDLIL